MINKGLSYIKRYGNFIDDVNSHPQFGWLTISIEEIRAFFSSDSMLE